MDKRKPVTITLINSSRLARTTRQAIGFSCAVIAPIALGSYLQSTAMQWVGFVFGFLVIIGVAKGMTDANTFSSVEAAKARLDEMVARGEAD